MAQRAAAQADLRLLPRRLRLHVRLLVLDRFTAEGPFSHPALDIKTYATARLKTAYCESTQRNTPRRWFNKLPHTYNAPDDSVKQGALFRCLLVTPFTQMRDSCKQGEKKLRFAIALIPQSAGLPTVST